MAKARLNRTTGYTLVVVLALAMAAGCGPSSKGGGGGEDAATHPDASSSDGAAPDSSMPGEQCDGIDDNGNGQVDEGCPCDESTQQECYPAPYHAPEGCEPGIQVCTNGSWGPCEGAEFPPEGALKCCSVLDESNPIYDALDRCVDAYPPSEIPQCESLSAWLPDDPECLFANVSANVADEFVDQGSGGVTVAHVEEGRAYTRQIALDDFSVSADDILYETQPAVEIEGVEGCSPGGRGFAWGSILYKTSLGAVGEIVYLYVGICYNGCDSEGFYRSAEPIEVCSEGTVE